MNIHLKMIQSSTDPVKASCNTILLVFFPKYLLSVPYNSKYESLRKIVHNLKTRTDRHIPEAVSKCLAIYPFQNLRYFYMRTPISLSPTTDLDILLEKQDYRTPLSCDSPIFHLKQHRDWSDASVSITLDRSLSLGSLPDEISKIREPKEWFEQVARRNLSFLYDTRFDVRSLLYHNTVPRYLSQKETLSTKQACNRHATRL
ncbi:hypothetical protein BDV98DRAFT_261029 [Pterulicium gracile]|uniref:Uncharacterized protein n=1 Tax=Pterulicium gracile TaxID=1884261 RepID=A0A5C3Q8X5_9AGAR|nr:hypothetical protein BDV98DRAFT_261029 [Pterula gracilis]